MGWGVVGWGLDTVNTETEATVQKNSRANKVHLIKRSTKTGLKKKTVGFVSR